MMRIRIAARLARWQRLRGRRPQRMRATLALYRRRNFKRGGDVPAADREFSPPAPAMVRTIERRLSRLRERIVRETDRSVFSSEHRVTHVLVPMTASPRAPSTSARAAELRSDRRASPQSTMGVAVAPPLASRGPVGPRGPQAVTARRLARAEAPPAHAAAGAPSTDDGRSPRQVDTDRVSVPARPTTGRTQAPVLPQVRSAGLREHPLRRSLPALTLAPARVPPGREGRSASRGDVLRPEPPPLIWLAPPVCADPTEPTAGRAGVAAPTAPPGGESSSGPGSGDAEPATGSRASSFSAPEPVLTGPALDRLAEDVMRRIARKARVERERQGR